MWISSASCVLLVGVSSLILPASAHPSLAPCLPPCLPPSLPPPLPLQHRGRHPTPNVLRIRARHPAQRHPAVPVPPGGPGPARGRGLPDRWRGAGLRVWGRRGPGERHSGHPSVRGGCPWLLCRAGLGIRMHNLEAYCPLWDPVMHAESVSSCSEARNSAPTPSHPWQVLDDRSSHGERQCSHLRRAAVAGRRPCQRDRGSRGGVEGWPCMAPGHAPVLCGCLFQWRRHARPTLLRRSVHR
jgi:hypothetical protein